MMCLLDDRVNTVGVFTTLLLDAFPTNSINDFPYSNIKNRVERGQEFASRFANPKRQ